MNSSPLDQLSTCFSSARWLAVASLALGLGTSFLHAQEGTGRAGFKEPDGTEVESEFYAGKRGYIHAGLGLIAPLNDTQRIGITGHVVRESTGNDLFPSLGMEFIQEFDSGFGLEAYSFGYLPVAGQHAWAVGLRGSRAVVVSDGLTVAPFFGPAFARVRAFDEDTGRLVNIDHLMFVGGLTLKTSVAEVTLFASHSFFQRDPAGLETHVDLEEMTHFAAFENNDGFARNTVGLEVSVSTNDWLTLSARYALILYEGETRHSVSFAPKVKITDHVEAFAGVQFLRGSGPGNNLLMAGMAFSF